MTHVSCENIMYSGIQQDAAKAQAFAVVPKKTLTDMKRLLNVEAE
jgi:hypothetical protein